MTSNGNWHDMELIPVGCVLKYALCQIEWQNDDTPDSQVHLIFRQPRFPEVNKSKTEQTEC